MDWMQDKLEIFVNSGAWEKWVAAAVIVIATAIVVHILSSIIRKLMSHDGVDLPSSSIFVNIARATVWVLGLSMMLSTCFGVDVNALIAALGVGGIAISLGFSDTISNFIGGLQVSLIGIVAPGDNIRVGSLQGVVQDVTWRQTVIKNLDGHLIIVPNSVINAGTVEKLADANAVIIPVFLPPDGRDLNEAAAQVIDAASNAAKGVGEVVVEPKVRFSEVTEFALKGILTFKMADVAMVLPATDAVIRAIAPLTSPQK